MVQKDTKYQKHFLRMVLQTTQMKCLNEMPRKCAFLSVATRLGLGLSQQISALGTQLNDDDKKTQKEKKPEA